MPRIDGMEHGIWQMAQDQVIKTIEAKAKARFRPAPDVTAVEPSSGLTTGDTVITITGDFLGVAKADVQSISFGGPQCTNITWVSSAEVLCVPENISSAGAGMYNLTFTTRSGGEGFALVDAFEYKAPPPVIVSANNTRGFNGTAAAAVPGPRPFLPSAPVASGETMSSVNVSWAAYPNAVAYRLFMDADNYTLALNSWQSGSSFSTSVDNLATNSTYRFLIEVTFRMNASSSQLLTKRSLPSESITTLASEYLSDLTTQCQAEGGVYAGQSDTSFNRGQLFVPSKSGVLTSLTIPVCVEAAGRSGVTVEVSIFNIEAGKHLLSMKRTFFQSKSDDQDTDTEPVLVRPMSEVSICPEAVQETHFKLDKIKVRADTKYMIAMRRVNQGRDPCVELDGSLMVDPTLSCEGPEPHSKCLEYPMLAARRCFVRSRLFWLSAKHSAGGSYASKAWPPSDGKELKYGFCNGFKVTLKQEAVGEIVEEVVHAAKKHEVVKETLVESKCNEKDTKQSEQEFLGDSHAVPPHPELHEAMPQAPEIVASPDPTPAEVEYNRMVE